MRLVRLLLWTLGAVLMWTAATSALFYQNVRQANASQMRSPLPPAAVPQAGERLVVFSPHCDDETLGVGGLIHLAKRNGARVRVVMMTNGDGFPLAAARQYLHPRPGPKENLRLARDRQRESIAALAELGVPKADITFLGYPDRGLSSLWERHWLPENPYTSPHTAVSRSPYDNSYTRGAPYAGSSLLADVEAILREEQPTTVIMPHAADDHPDHWATHCFVSLALGDLRLRPGSEAAWSAAVKIRTYLVHRGEWPVPKGLHPDARLAPPAALANVDAGWESLELPAPARAAKHRALRQYRTQMSVMGRFLTSFARRNELLGRGQPTLKLSASGTRDAAGDGFPNVIDDPTGDTLIREVEGAADVTSLSASVVDDRLVIRLRTRRPLSKWVSYRVMARPLGSVDASAAGLPVDVRCRAYQCDDGEVDFRYEGNDLRVSVPLSRLQGAPAVMLGAETRLGKVSVDRVAWRIIRLVETSPGE